MPINLQLINFLGFAVGGILYAMLGVMAMPRRVQNLSDDYPQGETRCLTSNHLLIAVAVCGCLWNTGGLFEIVWQDFFGRRTPVFLAALAYSALGLLPALIIHFKGQNENGNIRGKSNSIKWAAYGLSIAAALMHFSAAAFSSRLTLSGEDITVSNVKD